MGVYELSNAKCPYWKKGDEHVIRCEGYVKKQTHTFMFDVARERLKWSEDLCCGDWRRCPWAKMLNSKYGQ